MTNREDKPTRVIACGVFKPALEYLGIRHRIPDVRLTFLPTHLHIDPRRLRHYILRHLNTTRRRGERSVCLYGDCFPAIAQECGKRGSSKMPGCHCYEILLGSGRFREIMEESARTYFLERDLIVDFEKFCMEPLELHDSEMRRFFFNHYRRLVYVRQPLDEDLIDKAAHLAHFLDLALEVHDADYTELERRLMELITPHDVHRHHPVNRTAASTEVLRSGVDE